MEIVGEDRELRATILDDGQVNDKNNNVIGFINEDGASGDANQNFLGEINDDGQISNQDNQLIGSINLGLAEMRDENGSHFCTVLPGGDLVDAVDGFKGHVDNFTFHKLKVIGAYLFFFDQNLIDPKKPSKVVEVKNEEAAAPTEENITADLTLPSPSPAPPKEEALPAVTLAAPVRKVSVEDRPYKNYRVGDFKTLPGGKENLLEIYDCDCQSSQLSVRLEKEGKQVVYQRTIQTQNNRKQQVQRFTIPYQVVPERVKVTYDKKRENGTLAILLTKPEAGGAAGGGGSTSGEFTKFSVDAVAGSDGKITMKPAQTKEYFQFVATGDPKLPTEVIGELVDGEQVKFHAITTDLEAGVKKKATQTFTLPAKVTLDHFEILNGGKEVKVYQQKKTTGGSAAPAATSTVPDTDIKIIVL